MRNLDNFFFIWAPSSLKNPMQSKSDGESSPERVDGFQPRASDMPLASHGTHFSDGIGSLPHGVGDGSLVSMRIASGSWDATTSPHELVTTSPAAGSMTDFGHLVQSVMLPSRVIASAIRTPFKIAMKGKRRPTWSTEMEIVITAFRSACRHAPRDLSLLRAFTDVAVPSLLLPRGAVRHETRLHGLEIEWVFPHSLLKDQRGRDADAPSSWMTVSSYEFSNDLVLAWSSTHPVVLYLHGGGHALCGPQTHRNIVASFAVEDVVLCVPNYRRPPEVTIIDAVDDCFSTYRHLVEVIGIPPSRIAFMGDSAGAALVILTMCRVRDLGLPLPSCAALLSPWSELDDPEIVAEAEKGNIMPDHDYLPRDALVMISRLVVGNMSAQDPRINPMSADLSGLPKILIHVGEVELLFDQIVRFYERLREEGNDVKMKIWVDSVHVPHAFTTVSEEGRAAVKDAAEYIKKHTGTSPPLADTS